MLKKNLFGDTEAYLIFDDTVINNKLGYNFESQTRWKIEYINREIKQLTGLGFCHCRLRIIQENNIACEMERVELFKKICF